MCAGFWSFDLKRIKKIKALMKYERPKLRRYAQKRSLFLMKTEFLAEISFHFRLLYFVRALDRHFSPLQLYCEWTQICFYSHMFRLNYPLGIAWPQKCQIKTSLAWYEASFGKSAGTIASVEAQFAKWSALLFTFTRARKPQRLKALSVCTLWDSYSVCICDIQVRKFKNYKFKNLKVCFCMVIVLSGSKKLLYRTGL